jgi:TetR/AcrR family transcriptional regulator, lmrAB and yxaGH operons repressor
LATARDRIIDTTAVLLERQGYHATGVKQIVEASNSPKGSLYYHFPEGKEEIAAGVVERVARDIGASIRGALARHDDPAEAVRGFVLELAEYVQRADCRGGSPITLVALETAGESERLQKACSDAYADWEGAFADKLVAGGFAPERAANLATLVNAAVEGAVILSRIHQNIQPLARVADELRGIIRAASRD